MFVDFERFDGSAAETRGIPVHLQRPDIAFDGSPQIDFGGVNVTADHGPPGHDHVGFRLDVSFDLPVDMESSAAADAPLYGRSGGDDGGMAWAAMWLTSAMKDSHGTCFTFLKMVRYFSFFHLINQ